MILEENQSVEPTTSTTIASKNKKIKSIETQESTVVTKSAEQMSNLSSFSCLQEERAELKEKSLKEIYQLASINEFPKKLFIFANKRRLYSERLHFFESIRVFNST